MPDNCRVGIEPHLICVSCRPCHRYTIGNNQNAFDTHHCVYSHTQGLWLHPLRFNRSDKRHLWRPVMKKSVGDASLAHVLTVSPLRSPVHWRIGVERFELPTPCSQNKCSSKLNYTPWVAWSDSCCYHATVAIHTLLPQQNVLYRLSTNTTAYMLLWSRTCYMRSHRNGSPVNGCFPAVYLEFLRHLLIPQYDFKPHHCIALHIDGNTKPLFTQRIFIVYFNKPVREACSAFSFWVTNSKFW